MAHPSPRLVEVARRILEREGGGSSDPGASAAALDTACRKLKEHLVDFLGSTGVSAVFRRALHVAQRDEPLLAHVAVTGEPAACFTRLSESLTASTAEEANAAVVAVLTHLLDLLVTLLGEELGMKPIQKLWPHQTSDREIDE